MTYHNVEELKELIAARLDIEEILDILGWDMPELIDVLEEYINEKQEEFEAAVR